MRKLTTLILIIGLSSTVSAKSGRKSQKVTKKLGAYVELLNLSGRSVKVSGEDLARWKKRTTLGKDCAKKEIRWPTGLVTQFMKLEPNFKSAVQMKGKTEVDALAKRWLEATVALGESDRKVTDYFNEQLYKKDNCLGSKLLVDDFENKFSEYTRSRWEVSAYFKKKEQEQMKTALKKIKKKHGDGFWYAQANLLLQEKLLLALAEKARTGDKKALLELSKNYKTFLGDLEKLNSKMKKKERIVGVQSSYVGWAKETNLFSKIMQAFIEMQDHESFSKLERHEKKKLENRGSFKRLISAFNHGVDKSNQIQYSKEFH